MSRFIRNSAILAKIETTSGTDSVPVGASNAMLVSNMSITPLVSSNVSRDLIRPYFGGSEQLVGTAYVELSFDVEIQSSGSMVTPTVPAWDPLLRSCGFAATSAAGIRVEYNPITAAMESSSIYYHADGVLHKLLGARGNVSLKMGIGERPVFSFKMLGLDGGISAVANPSVTLTAFKTPLIVTDPNTGDIMFGCTYTAATPAITGGTSQISRGLQIDLGNAVSHIPLLGGESISITQRETTGSVELDLSAADEVTYMATVKAATTQAIGLQHGTAAGYKVLIFAPAVQLINPKHSDVSGRMLCGYDLRFLPSSGNDEIKIIAA